MDFEIFFSFLLRGLLQNEGKPTDRVERTVAVRLAGKKKKRTNFLYLRFSCVCHERIDGHYSLLCSERGGGIEIFSFFLMLRV